jgi:hypothetical protein
MQASLCLAAVGSWVTTSRMVILATAAVPHRIAEFQVPCLATGSLTRSASGVRASADETADS